MLKVYFYPLNPQEKVNILAAGRDHTRLFKDEDEKLRFEEMIIPVVEVSEKGRLVENVKRDGELYDELFMTELTYLTGYGFIDDTVLPEEAVQAINEDNVVFEEISELPEKPRLRILYFEERLEVI